MTGVQTCALSIYLEALATSYTMQTQRDVHEEVMGTALKASAPLTLGDTTPDRCVEGDFGENVELF